MKLIDHSEKKEIYTKKSGVEREILIIFYLVNGFDASLAKLVTYINSKLFDSPKKLLFG